MGGMMDTRKIVAEQIGQLVLTNIELVAANAAKDARIAALEKTQSKGKAKAEKHLAEQPNKAKPK